MTGYLFLYELTKLALCNNTIIVLYYFTTIVLCQCADPPSNQPSCMASCSGYSTADKCATFRKDRLEISQSFYLLVYMDIMPSKVEVRLVRRLLDWPTMLSMAANCLV